MDQKKHGFYQMQKDIVAILKSNTLKQEIERSMHVFSEAELLAVANCFARTYEERIQLFKMIEENASSGISGWARACIEWQKKMLALFKEPEENVVFELHINETPNSYDERYLCSTFETAVNSIQKFYGKYKCTETMAARYLIEKRRIMTGAPLEVFDEDCLGECCLLPGGVIQSVCVYDFGHEKPCCGLCSDCKDRCADCYPVCFPRFLENKALVRYEKNDGSVRYGIHFAWNNKEPDDNIYIIPLDTDIMRYHNFGSAHDTHEHIDDPFVEKICADELPGFLKDNYKAYAKYLEKHAW